MKFNAPVSSLLVISGVICSVLGVPVASTHEQEAANKFGDIATLIETSYKRDVKDFANYGLDNGEVAHKKFGDIATLIETSYKRDNEDATAERAHQKFGDIATLIETSY
ncbi:hypothetical protein NLG97_g94 [Lecanicillium saksenae]|uniref:Uncharacterized protein n=1 Tax=Lecanicillium saksenae TaxID=468837 RepID=A0ACC1R7K9_9HYPO|nr:hypothetical protein NLG97_g94 [Lecanicillium saksenae]